MEALVRIVLWVNYINKWDTGKTNHAQLNKSTKLKLTLEKEIQTSKKTYKESEF